MAIQWVPSHFPRFQNGDQDGGQNEHQVNCIDYVLVDILENLFQLIISYGLCMTAGLDV